QMRRLEERIGKQLFIKDGRGNRLTVEGEKLLNYARRIIRLNNEAIASFDDNRLEGTLRICTPDDYADRFMMPICTGGSAGKPYAWLSTFMPVRS
ncbi:hypothetical protein ACC696_37680, partial [Rhizobium ruizarguesonis]